MPPRLGPTLQQRLPRGSEYYGQVFKSTSSKVAPAFHVPSLSGQVPSRPLPVNCYYLNTELPLCKSTLLLAPRHSCRSTRCTQVQLGQEQAPGIQPSSFYPATRTPTTPLGTGNHPRHTVPTTNHAPSRPTPSSCCQPSNAFYALCIPSPSRV